MPPLKDVSDKYGTHVVGGGALSLVNRHVLSTHTKEKDMVEQRDNSFQTKFHINNKVCVIIIDGRRYTNVSSTFMVEKLNLHF